MTDIIDLESLKARLLKYSKWNGDCLESTYKARAPNGYAIMKYGKTTRGAHRISWMVHKGEIPPKLLVCHTCDNPLCINPEHLFLGTASENMQDMISKGRDNIFNARKHPHWIVEECIKMKKEGKTYNEMSKKFGICISSIANFMLRKKFHHEMKEIIGKPKYSQEFIDKAINLRKSGIKCKDIQKMLGIPKRSLTTIMKKFYSKNK